MQGAGAAPRRGIRRCSYVVVNWAGGGIKSMANAVKQFFSHVIEGKAAGLNSPQRASPAEENLAVMVVQKFRSWFEFIRHLNLRAVGIGLEAVRIAGRRACH